MSFEGFLESEYSPTVMSGQYDSTYGSKVGFTLGSKYDHVFGNESRLFCDPTDLFPESPLWTLLMGMTGKADFAYGGATSAHYAGRDFKIHRVPKRYKDSEYDFSTPENAAISFTKAGLDPIDLPVAQAVAVLSTLMCAIALALDLSLHFRYPKFGSDDKDDKPTIDSYGLTPKLIKAFSVMLVSRLMAVMRLLEIRADHANRATQAAEDGAAEVVQAAGSLTVQVLVVNLSVEINMLVVETSEDSMEEAAGALIAT